MNKDMNPVLSSAQRAMLDPVARTVLTSPNPPRFIPPPSTSKAPFNPGENVSREEFKALWPNAVAPSVQDVKVEKDPNGKNPHEAGAKLDSGKLRPGLVLGSFARALKAVTEIGTYGARKYSDGGWLEVPNGINRYKDAELRHWLDAECGIELDADTGMLHLAHKAWNALAVLELTLREKEKAKNGTRP